MFPQISVPKVLFSFLYEARTNPDWKRVKRSKNLIKNLGSADLTGSTQ